MRNWTVVLVVALAACEARSSGVASLPASAQEAARKQLREAGLAFPDAASCPAGSMFGYHFQERPDAVLAGCWGGDGNEPVGWIVRWPGYRG